MNKIARVALEAQGFKNIDAILVVVNATDNPSVALEMLLDVYEKPELEPTSKYKDDAVLTEFNPFASSYPIRFSYKSRKRKSFYYDADVITEETVKQLVLTGDYKAPEIFGEKKEVYCNTHEFTKSNDTCSIKQWIDGK